MKQMTQLIKIRFLLTFFISMSLYMNITFAQTVYPIYYHVITLQKETSHIENANYYIKSVIDCRPDTTNIGIIKEGLLDSKYPAKLDTCLYLSLKRYFDDLLPYNKDKTPVIIKITYFDISEKADASNDNGKTDIKMEFYTQNNNSFSKIFETEQISIYSNYDVTKMHEQYIRETLNKCIHAFLNTKITNNNSDLISYDQLISVSPIKLTDKEDALFYPKAYYSKINLTISGGFGLFFDNSPQSYPKELKKYVKGTQYASNYGFDFSYFFTKMLGLGFNYARYASDNSLDHFKIYDENNVLQYEGNISDNIRITRFGPSINYRALLKNSNVFLKTSLSYNRLHYLDNGILFSLPSKIEFYTNCVVGKIDLDYYLFKNIALNFSVSTWLGKNKDYEWNGILTKLEKKTYMLRSDANLGITLSY
jgi:hypothetical protein